MKKDYGIENIYYQDESGFDQYFTRLYGYGFQGNKIFTTVSGKKYERQSVMALRNSKHLLVEPIIYPGTADADLVEGYFEQTLPKLGDNSVVILDNASFHKSKKLKEIFKKYNCHLVFLPPYSPDFNPIENIWGTVKVELRNYYDYTLSLFDNLSLCICKYSV